MMTIDKTSLKQKLLAQQADLPKALQKKKHKAKKCGTFGPIKESTNADILKDLVSLKEMKAEPGVHDEVIVEPNTASETPEAGDIAALIS